MFLFEREGACPRYDVFLNEFSEEILKIFESLLVESNYFSMREGLKT